MEYLVTGKSHISYLISEKLDVVLLSNDQLRKFIYETKFPLDKVDDFVKKIQSKRIKECLEKGNICLLDANISIKYKEKLSMMESYGFPFYILRLICDEKCVLDRIEKRNNNKYILTDMGEYCNYSGGSIKTYYRMKEEREIIPDELIFFTIDTSFSKELVEMQINKFIDKIKLVNNL